MLKILVVTVNIMKYNRSQEAAKSDREDLLLIYAEWKQYLCHESIGVRKREWTNTPLGKLSINNQHVESHITKRDK